MQNAIEKSQFLNLPLPLICIICDFLKIKDINRTASTCKTLYIFLYIKVQKYEKNKSNNQKSVPKSLFWSINIKKQNNHYQTQRTLKMIKFIFVVKEQIYCDTKDATSWIEAEFLQKNGQSLIQQKISKFSNQSKNRYPLISNYCHSGYIPKVFYLSDEIILKDLAVIQIYLRTKYQKQFIYCKMAEVKLIYCYSDIRISPLQLKQTIKSNKKKSIITY